jgi:peptide/nickel transport system permease protein
MTTFTLIMKKFIRDRLAVTGMVILLCLALTAIFAPYIATHPRDVFAVHPAERLQPPNSRHLFGTDDMGRDLFSRVIYGSRISISISIIAVAVSLAIGVPIGLIAGYYEIRLSEFLMRISDIFLAIPQIILALALAASLGPSIRNVILALSFTYWPWFTRTVYAETRSIKKSVFIEATEALGASAWRTIIYHVLPNVSSSIIIRTSLGMGYTILTASVLGFLGVGAQPPTPEWGVTIANSRRFLPEAWWFATFPGLAIFVVVMGFNMLGDGLRDILDPRIRRAMR